jgi:hypothetical protein
MEIEPLSYDRHQELYGGGVDEFTLYSLGYWLQQNKDLSESRAYIKLREQYDDKLTSTN